MKLFTKTWEQDLVWLNWAFRSIYKFCDEQIVWHIVVEDDMRGEVRRIADECAKDINTPHRHEVIIHGLVAWPELSAIKDDYMGQQWVKMMAHRVIGDDLVWAWDSDVCAQRHFTEANFLGKNGLPIYWFSEIDRLKSCENNATGATFYDIFCKRAKVLESMFSCKVSREWMRCMPIPLIGSILKKGSEHSAWGKAFQECVAGNHMFSEFNVIAQYAYIYFNNSFDWKDEDIDGPTWGGFQSTFFNRSCGDATIACQYYSWGGETPEFKNWLKKEFK